MDFFNTLQEITLRAELPECCFLVKGVLHLLDRIVRLLTLLVPKQVFLIARRRPSLVFGFPGVCVACGFGFFAVGVGERAAG